MARTMAKKRKFRPQSKPSSFKKGLEATAAQAGLSKLPTMALVATVFHLFRLGAIRQRQKLMPQTNAKHRHIAGKQRLQFFYNRNTLCRVSRSIRKHNTVRLPSQHFLRRSKSRIDAHLAPPAHQRIRDVCLCSEIH